MPDIAAVAESDQGRILIMASWVDDPSITYGRVIRIEPDGTEVVVRNNISANSDGYMELSGGLMYVYDTEAPMDTLLTYRSEGWEDITSGATSTTVSWNNDHPWFKSPLEPWLDQSLQLATDVAAKVECIPDDWIYFASMEAETRPNRSALFPVDQRKNPIPSTRMRGGITSALRLISRTFVGRDLIIRANDPGFPLFFQAPAIYGIPDRYFVVGDYTVSRLSPNHRQEWRANLMPHTEVDRPEGLAAGVLGNRWADICEPYETFDDAEAAGITWSMILLGYATDPPVNPDFRLYGDIPIDFATYADIPVGGRTYLDLLEGD